MFSSLFEELKLCNVGNRYKSSISESFESQVWHDLIERQKCFWLLCDLCSYSFFRILLMTTRANVEMKEMLRPKLAMKVWKIHRYGYHR